MGVGELGRQIGHHVGRKRVALPGHQPITQADQVIAHVDGRRRAVAAVQGGPIVADLVVVLDVVVYQRGLVKNLDGQGNPPHGVRQPGNLLGPVRFGGRTAGQGVVDGQRDERTRVLPARGEEVVGNRFGAGDRIEPFKQLAVFSDRRTVASRWGDQSGQFGWLEHLRCTSHQMHIGPRLYGRVTVWGVDHLPDGVGLGRRVAATVAQQRNGHAGNAGQKDLVERLLEHIEAGDAQHGINMPAENDLHDGRRALGDQYPISLASRVGPQFGQTARPAIFAQQPGRVVLGRTYLDASQTMG